jgi:hypothetical protein
MCLKEWPDNCCVCVIVDGDGEIRAGGVEGSGRLELYRRDTEHLSPDHGSASFSLFYMGKFPMEHHPAVGGPVITRIAGKAGASKHRPRLATQSAQGHGVMEAAHGPVTLSHELRDAGRSGIAPSRPGNER